MVYTAAPTPTVLTHSILADSSSVICWTSPFVILGVCGLFSISWKIMLGNTVDPDQMPHYMASDQGLQCLPMPLLQPSEWVKQYFEQLVTLAKLKHRNIRLMVELSE